VYEDSPVNTAFLLGRELRFIQNRYFETPPNQRAEIAKIREELDIRLLKMWQRFKLEGGNSPIRFESVQRSASENYRLMTIANPDPTQPPLTINFPAQWDGIYSQSARDKMKSIFRTVSLDTPQK